MKRLSFLSVGALCSLVGCQSVSDTLPPLPIRNPFVERYEPTLGALPAQVAVFEAPVLWTCHSLKSQLYFSKLQPVLGRETLFVADKAGKVLALDKTGKTLWTRRTNHSFLAGPTLVGNQLLLTTREAKVVALDESSGKTLWETKLSTEAIAPPAGNDRYVFVHAIDGSVTALEAETGQVLWRVDQSTPSLTLRYASAPVIAGEYVLVGLATGKVIALEMKSGFIAWEQALAMPRGRSEVQRMIDISASPLVKGNKVFAVNYQGKLVAIELATGKLLWERASSSYHDMAMDKSALYVTDKDHVLWAIDQKTGNTLWQQPALRGRCITGPVIRDNQVIVMDRAGYVYFVEAPTGVIVRSMHVKGKFYTTPLLQGDRLIAQSHSGDVIAIPLSFSG